MNRAAQKFFTLEFAAPDSPHKAVPRLWSPASSLPAAILEKPLSGLKIALDPGHLGGSWAKMEERWFQVGNSKPVQEGDLTLQVARLLARRLREHGAKVSSVRNSDEPATAKRPDDFRTLARKILIKNGVPQPRVDVLDPNDPAKEQTMPSLVPHNKGAAMSLLNLGAGASNWVGPAIVWLFKPSLGVGGVMWIYAVLYVISAVLALLLKLPEQDREASYAG